LWYAKNQLSRHTTIFPKSLHTLLVRDIGRLEDGKIVLLAEMPVASNVGMKQVGRFPEKLFITFQTLAD